MNWVEDKILSFEDKVENVGEISKEYVCKEKV